MNFIIQNLLYNDVDDDKNDFKKKDVEAGLTS